MPWTLIDTAELPGGEVMTLRRRGDDFEIRVGLYELMSSRNPVSERVMAKLAVERAASTKRVLIGGLGMGYTARAMLDESGPDTTITVAELVPAVVAWNRGPLADLARRPLDDSRVGIFAGDVAEALRTHPGGFDIILLDVDNGPEAVMFEGNGGLYTAAGLTLTRSALAPGGVLAVWAAAPSPAFETLAAGSSERIDVPVTGTLSHTLYFVGSPAAKMPDALGASSACKAAEGPI